ncbi:polarity establishment/cellular polarization [Didymosphaeria variabile]|uniref:Polarity establishment/cellular polarization n=1 Tax=Didymosphaeria variabile TaxID=1932322 RepID=A0A9W8XS64_9PLEO|nr:polarity establishment/cellular polarization [Didymosphaeria variabile]KAJ4357686.1 polarity establishment/cellular polarization [Didymosphaeria variabile]
MRLAALLCLLATVVATSPEVNFPLNLQLPPVARVGKPYNFQFSANTFQPDPDQLVYSIAGGPSWLHIHSENRTLWGTPGAQDAGTAKFTIVAAGEAGLVANMDTQLPIEKDDGPRADGDISQALSKLGQLSGPQNITLLPSKPFEFVLGQDLFEANGKKLFYYATLADHTPLPSWISFDAQRLRFAGTTPSSVNPQTFEVLLIASDTPDFAAASTSFTIVVSNHLLLFKPLMQTLNVTKGQGVDVTGLKGMLYLDNAPIRDDDIQSASVNGPKWLSFDDHSFDISGTPPSGLMSQDISVVVKDKFGGSAEHTIHLAFTSQLFMGEIGHLNVTPGVYFDHQISKSILSLDNETASMEFGKLNKWLSFDSGNLIVSGILPEDTAACTVEGYLTATSSDGKTKDTQAFQIDVLGTDAGNPSNSLNSDTEDNKSGGTDTKGSSKKKTGIIVGAVLSSLFAAAIFILLFLSFCRRRKNNEQGYISPGAPGSPRKKDISRPIPIATGIGDIDRAEYEDLEKGKMEDSPPRTLERPPQLHLLPLPLMKRGVYAHSRDTSLNDRDDNLLTTLHESFNFKAENEPIHHPATSMQIPTDMLRRKSAGSPDLQRKSTHDASKAKRRSSGFPVTQRSTRRSHAQSASRGTDASAAQRTLSSCSQTTALSTVPSAFPQPSKARHTMQFTTPLEKRQSIRPVVPSIYESPERVDRLLDRRTIDEKRHSYIRKRASAQQSPLFAGSRVSSSNYNSPPGFIGDPDMAQKTPLKAMSPNIFKANDTVRGPDSDLPESLRIRKPADTPSPATIHFDISKSLRKNRPSNGFGRRHTDISSAKSSDVIEPPPRSKLRPGTAVYQPTGMSSQTSTQSSLHGPMIRDKLNKTLGEQVFKDAELSESNYSSEEDDIIDAERRHTLKPSNSVRNWIGPLKIEKIDGKVERDSKRKSKRNSKRNSKALKRASERDPTPFYRPDRLEHGGKENIDSSLYSLADKSVKTSTTAESRHERTSASSPTRPKTSIGNRSKIRSGNLYRTVTRSPSNRTSTASSHPLPSSTNERHSRKSLHSRSQSQQSASHRPKRHSRSRTQSGAYPRWADIRESAKATSCSSTSTTRLRRDGDTMESTTTGRDGARNVGYGEDEAPCIEELRRESIGIGIGGPASPRHSRLVHMQSSPFYHSKRDTATRPSTPVQSTAVGLGLSLLEGGHAAEDATPGPESAIKEGRIMRESVVGGMGWERSPERLRVVEGKGRGRLVWR